jgi:RNA-directed DNA polymerase
MEFASDKTRIVKVTSGFDFLGWNFRLFHRLRGRKKHWMRSKSNFVTLVKPSLKSIKTLKQRIKEIWRKGIGKTAWLTILKLNPLITGWASYHKFVNSDKIFRSLDNFLYLQPVRFIRRTHPNKSWSWLIKRYFKTLVKERRRKNGKVTTSLNNWTFYDRIYLNMFRTVSLENFVSVQFGKNLLNPFDKGYFLQRKNERLVKRGKFLKVLFMRQNGLCPFCGSELSSDWDEPVHVHHIIPRSVGGPEVLSNLVLLHEECHHNLHSLGVKNFNTTKYLKKNSKTKN